MSFCVTDLRIEKYYSQPILIITLYWATEDTGVLLVGTVVFSPICSSAIFKTALCAITDNVIHPDSAGTFAEFQGSVIRGLELSEIILP